MSLFFSQNIAKNLERRYSQSSPIYPENGDYYISATATGSDDGITTSTPWTLAQLNAATLSAGDKVLFKTGDTFYGTLTVTSSGSSGNPITFGAYGSGNLPVISGWTTITSGWTDEGSGIYSKVITSDSQTNMVTIDGVEYGMGRYPNSGTYLTFESHSGTTSITDNELTSSPNWTGAEVVIRANDFTWTRGTITNHSGSTITYTGGTWTPGDGNGYFFQNSLQTLDTFGDWYHDTSAGKFYMYFGASNPTDYTIKVATKDYLITTSGQSYITVENLDIQGSISNAVYNSVSSTYFNIQNCNISFAGDWGIRINSQGGLIDNNTIHDCNQGAYKGENSYGTVTNNTIYDTGTIIGASTGYYIAMMIESGNDYIQVKYNSINNSGYNGIFIKSNYVEVQYNYINNTCLVNNDGGAIYTGGATGNTNMLIDHNIVLNVIGYTSAMATPFTLVHGVYLDEHADTITVTNNVFGYCGHSGIGLHYATNTNVDNNTFFNNGTDGIFFQNNSGSVVIWNDTITNNIIVPSSGNYTMYLLDLAASSPANITSDYNYFVAETGSNSTIKTLYNSTTTYRTLANWQTYSGIDTNSTEVLITLNDASLFYNATNGNVQQDLSGYTWRDLDGNSVTSLTLSPYTSKILVKQ